MYLHDCHCFLFGPRGAYYASVLSVRLVHTEPIQTWSKISSHVYVTDIPILEHKGQRITMFLLNFRTSDTLLLTKSLQRRR